MPHPKGSGQQSDRQAKCATMLEEALRQPGVREMMQVYRNWQRADQGLATYRSIDRETLDTTTSDRANIHPPKSLAVGVAHSRRFKS